MGPRSKNSPSRQMQLKRKAGWNPYSKEELQRKRIEQIREKFNSNETFRLKQLERVDLNRKVCIRCARPDCKRAHDQTCFVKVPYLYRNSEDGYVKIAASEHSKHGLPTWLSKQGESGLESFQAKEKIVSVFVVRVRENPIVGTG